MPSSDQSPSPATPAAVCILPQRAARRLAPAGRDRAELVRDGLLVEAEDGYSLRWFTPKVEVDLCGHATLASAHVLWEEKHVRPDETIHFHTRSGVLKAVRRQDIIELDFPLIPEEPAAAAPCWPGEALGVQFKYVGKGRFDYLLSKVEVVEPHMRSLAPNFRQYSSLPVGPDSSPVGRPGPSFDFVSRFLRPACRQSTKPPDWLRTLLPGGVLAKHLHKDSFHGRTRRRHGAASCVVR